MGKEIFNHHIQENKENYYKEKRISLEAINVLPQPRKTFEKIDELANDILEKGLINPLLVACFNKESIEKYLRVINRLWKKEIKTEIRPENLKINSDGNYYILIAGERRLRSIKSFKKNPCFDKIFPEGKIESRIIENPSPLQALFRQASENIHQKPPAWEEAAFYVSLFDLICEEKGKYPITRFAKDVGKDPETIRKSIQFSLLPKFVQNAVINKEGLAYGAACELWRMVKDLNPKVNFKENDINFMASKATIGRWTIDRCRKEVIKKIQETESNQPSFEIFTKEDQERMEKLYFKNSVAQEIEKGSWDFVRFLKRVNVLIEEKQINTKESPFTEEKTLRAFLFLIKEQEKILPHLEKISQEEKEKSKEVIKRSEKAIEEIIVYSATNEKNNLS